MRRCLSNEQCIERIEALKEEPGDSFFLSDDNLKAELERLLGLRSSFELDHEEGHVFLALSADRYPIGVMGRRNAVGDLFVSRIISCPYRDFSTAVDKITQDGGVELIVGSEAKELLCKMEQVTGVVSRTDKKKEIWEVEECGSRRMG